MPRYCYCCTGRAIATAGMRMTRYCYCWDANAALLLLLERECRATATAGTRMPRYCYCYRYKYCYTGRESHATAIAAATADQYCFSLTLQGAHRPVDDNAGHRAKHRPIDRIHSSRIFTSPRTPAPPCWTAALCHRASCSTCQAWINTIIVSTATHLLQLHNDVELTLKEALESEALK